MEYKIISSQGYFNYSSYMMTFFIQVGHNIYEFYETELFPDEMEKELTIAKAVPKEMEVSETLCDTKAFEMMYGIMIADDLTFVDNENVQMYLKQRSLSDEFMEEE